MAMLHNHSTNQKKDTIMNINIGKFQVDILSGGKFLLDGGTMFGVVPKTLWSKQVEVDERNRIEMETNCLLVRDESKTILIESGIGYGFSRKERDIYGMEKSSNILESLKNKGVDPGDIDMVFLTHLHFDHAGGVVKMDNQGKPAPVFPNAKHVIQRREWEDAINNFGIMKSSYNPEKLKVLEECGALQLVEGDCEPVPGIKCMKTPGHNRGHQIITVESNGQTILFCGDLIPCSSHLKISWIAAYDLFPYDISVEKRDILESAVKGDWLLVFYHDPNIKVARVRKNTKSAFDPVVL